MADPGGSTSIPAPPIATESKPDGKPDGKVRAPIERRQIRRLGPVLTATRLVARQAVTFADGTTRPVPAGDWILTQGAVVLDTCPAAGFPGSTYQIVDDQQRTLSADDRHRLEAVLGLGATDSPTALLAAVSRLARLSIGEVAIDFTPGQWEELTHRARKRGQTVRQAVEAVVSRIRDELWHRQGGV